MARKRLGEILMTAGLLTETGLNAALSEQRRWGGQLGRILVDMRLMSEEALVQALSHQLNFPIVDVSTRKISPKVLDLISSELAERHGIIPFNVEGKFLDVAMSDPTNLGIVDELRIRTQLNVRSYLCGPKQLERALARHYGRGPATIGITSGAYDLARLQEQDDAISGTSHMVAFDESGKAAHIGVPQLNPTVAAKPQGPPPASASPAEVRTREVRALQARLSELEALVQRDEDVLRKLLGLLVDKGIATREEILERIK